MADDRQREPLWASGLAHQPVPVRDERFDPPAPAGGPEDVQEPASAAFTLAIALMAVLTLMLAAAIVTGRTAYTRETVASGWGDIPMTCDTQRFDRDDRAFELFQCTAVGGGRLPPGLYESPRALWRSDLTGQEAAGNVIRITGGGALTGFAVY